MDLKLIIVGILIGIVFDIVDGYVSNKYPKLRYRKKNFALHHSLYGLVLIILGLIFNVVLLVWFGIGIILSHSIREKSLLFFEYRKKKYF